MDEGHTLEAGLPTAEVATAAQRHPMAVVHTDVQCHRTALGAPRLLTETGIMAAGCLPMVVVERHRTEAEGVPPAADIPVAAEVATHLLAVAADTPAEVMEATTKQSANSKR